jgi:hypothetical protein
MIKRFRIWLARRILGAHCPCYQMGGDNMVNFQQRSADKLKSFTKKKSNESDPTVDYSY